MKSLDAIELYDISHWNRATIADGNFLSGVTIYPLSANDYTLLSAIDVFQENTAEVANENHQRIDEVGSEVSDWVDNLSNGIYPRIESYNAMTKSILIDDGPRWDKTSQCVDDYKEDWNNAVESAHSGYAASAFILDPGINASKIIHSAFYYCADGKQNWFTDTGDHAAVKNHSMYVGFYEHTNETNAGIAVNWSYCQGSDASIKGRSVGPAAQDHSFSILGWSAGGSSVQIKGSANAHHAMTVGMNNIGNSCDGIYFGLKNIKGNSSSIIHGIEVCSGVNHSINLGKGFYDAKDTVVVKGQANGLERTQRELLIGDSGGTKSNTNSMIIVDINKSGPAQYMTNAFTQGGTGNVAELLAPCGMVSYSKCLLLAGGYAGKQGYSLLVGRDFGDGADCTMRVGHNFSQVSRYSLMTGHYSYSDAYGSLGIVANSKVSGSYNTGIFDNSTTRSYQSTLIIRFFKNESCDNSFLCARHSSVNACANSLVCGQSKENASYGYSMVLGIKGVGTAYDSIFNFGGSMPFMTVTGSNGSKRSARCVLSHYLINSFVSNQFHFNPTTAYSKPNSYVSNDGTYAYTYRKNSVAITEGYEVNDGERQLRDFLIGYNNKQSGTGQGAAISRHSVDLAGKSLLWAYNNFFIGDFTRRSYAVGENIIDWSKLYNWTNSYAVNVGNNSHETDTVGAYFTHSDVNLLVVGKNNGLGYTNPTGYPNNIGDNCQFNHNLIVGEENTAIIAPGAQCIIVGKNNKITIPWSTSSYNAVKIGAFASMICIGENCDTNKTMIRRVLGSYNKSAGYYELLYDKSNTEYDSNYPLTKLIKSIKGVSTSEVENTKRAAYFLSCCNVILSKSDGPYCVISNCPAYISSATANGVYFRKSDNKWYDVKTGTAIA